MKEATLLWVDARLNKTEGSGLDRIDLQGNFYLSENVSMACTMVSDVNPDVIIFDFDYADITGLRALKTIREKYPHIPLLMLAEQHYEGLSIWALRCRVWDYLIKPHHTDTLIERVEKIINEINDKWNDLAWMQLLSANTIPSQASIIGTTRISYNISAAVGYIEAHLHERISAEQVSSYCGLTRYELSRAFKSEYNLTFRDFILKMRMQRAAKMLSSTEATISEIALSIGFNDISHFTRQFRRYFGCSAKTYRSNQHLNEEKM